MQDLWTAWWTFSTEGRAIGGLQFLSCLMYDDGRNPAFDGMSPPQWWADSIAANHLPWDPQNICFLRSVLVPDRLCAAIDKGLHLLTNPEDQQIALKMKDDFEKNRVLLELRIEQLLTIVSSDHYLVIGWTI